MNIFRISSMDLCLTKEMTTFQVFTQCSFITAGGSTVHDLILEALEKCGKMVVKHILKRAGN